MSNDCTIKKGLNFKNSVKIEERGLNFGSSTIREKGANFESSAKVEKKVVEKSPKESKK